jgi:hypothetical protein
VELTDGMEDENEYNLHRIRELIGTPVGLFKTGKHCLGGFY